MIKNESKIIERCLIRSLEYIDAISILDTGSTDNTIEICQKYLESCGKPFKISVEPFQNFGYNRTISFQKTVELCSELKWNLTTTYALSVDADMIIKPSSEFKNFKMIVAGYKLIQHNGDLKYFNTRFMQCSYNWKCVGVTHEYWSGDPVESIPYEIFNIDDINDGGCKSDKFERDIRLLSEDLKVDPNNGRTHFYLAQSYKDGGKTKEAIEHYLKRIELGGWYEEIWYSYYQIAKCYADLKQPENMEAWALKAFKIHPSRSEPLYYLTNYFRIHSEHYKAYHYYLKGKDIPFPNSDQLFIEYNIYNGLFEFENTIISFYINKKSKQDALVDIIKYINTYNFHLDNVWNNIIHYTDSLTSQIYKGEYTKLFFSAFNEYQVSSCSIIPYEDKFLMNTRLVNYSIDNQGQYNIGSSDNIVKTKNAITYLNSSYYPLENITIMKENIDKTYPSNIEGLEDIRLFTFKDNIYFTASSKNLTDTGKIVIAIGEYIPNEYIMKNISVIQPPSPSECEKNWIFVPETTLISTESAKNKMNFIYEWYPFKIGAINNNKLDIHTVYDTPPFFSRFRGSSNICEYNGYLWCVVHFVQYCTPRKYIHSIVAFNRDSMKPLKYSLPFVFKNHAIEYCLGFHISDGKACCIFSQNDNEPGFITIPITNLRFESL